MMKGALKSASAICIASGVAVGGYWVAPAAMDAVALLSMRDDPQALSSHALSANLDDNRLALELDSALAAGDIDLAISFDVLAKQQALRVPERLRRRLDEETSTAATVKRSAGDFFRGVAQGQASGGAGLAGVVAADLTGIGDLRDLAAEARKASRGEEPDRLTIGLAAAGLALTAATIAAVGVTLPVRAGVSTLRTAARTGRLSRPLMAEITGLASRVIEPAALSTAGSALARFDVVAARASISGAINPLAVRRIQQVAGDVSMLGRRAGVRAAQDGLAIAENSADLRRLARLADARGPSTRAVLKVLGRGAITLGSGVAALAGWAIAGVAYAWILFATAVSLATRALRVSVWGARICGRGACRLLGVSAMLWRRRVTPAAKASIHDGGAAVAPS